MDQAHTPRLVKVSYGILHEVHVVNIYHNMCNRVYLMLCYIYSTLHLTKDILQSFKIFSNNAYYINDS